MIVHFTSLSYMLRPQTHVNVNYFLPFSLSLEGNLTSIYERAIVKCVSSMIKIVKSKDTLKCLAYNLALPVSYFLGYLLTYSYERHLFVE